MRSKGDQSKLLKLWPVLDPASREVTCGLNLRRSGKASPDRCLLNLA